MTNDCTQDCSGEWGGEAIIDAYWFDSDGDGKGAGNSTEFCDALLPDGWVLNNDDPEPDCITDDTDCAGLCGGTSILDECDVCDGGNAAKDCAGVCFGLGVLDNCNVCDADSSNDCTQDCSGEWGGAAEYLDFYYDGDEDGLGAGDAVEFCDILSPDGWVLNNQDGDDACTSNFHDCHGLCDGLAVIDDCGVCDGFDLDKDCAGVCFGSSVGMSRSLNLGNNLVSFYVMPHDLEVSSVFSSSSIYSVLGEGVAAIPIGGFWHGSLSAIDDKSGYWVQSNEAQNLDVCGNYSSDVVYNLHSSNNLISYPFAESQYILDALPDNLNNEVYAIVGEGVAAINLNNSWLGSLQKFNAGNGYWFARSSNADNIEFSYQSPESQIHATNERAHEELLNAPSDYSYVQSTKQAFYFIESLSVSEDFIDGDSWVLAYNNETLVGARLWSGPYTDVPAMGNEGSLNTQDYMDLGGFPAFKLLNIASGKLTDLRVDNHIDGWNNNSVYVVQLSSTPELPESIMLESAYPNPFNPSTTLSFSIPYDMVVDLSVYDVSGRVVANLVSGMQSADRYNIEWDAGNFSSGVYFVKLMAGSDIRTQKIMLIK